MKIPSTTTQSLINDPFIYLAHVLDFSIWTIITWTVVVRSSCSNKFSHKSTEMNAFCIFQISDCIWFSLCGFPVSEGNCGSGLERTSISMKNIYFNIIFWYTSILNDNWAANFARPFWKGDISLLGLAPCLLMLYLLTF